MNPTVMQGEMNAVLGEDGLGEAIARRWLVPNYESGYLQVSPSGSIVEEMQAIAAMPDPTPAPDTLGESRNALPAARDPWPLRHRRSYLPF
jgi:hypothetical protein